MVSTGEAELTKQFARDLFKAIGEGLERKKLDSFKRAACARLHLPNAPKNHVLLHFAPKNKRELYKSVLMKTPMRSSSGVSVVAVMPKYFHCYGLCTYCPTSSIAPKSYTGYEPAALRARHNDFNAFAQVRSRLKQFIENGHTPSKCELIVMGGTFNAFAPKYQNEFVKDCFDAFNAKKSATLAQAQKLNEKSKHRVIGLTFETRPDWAGRKQVSALLDFGATRIELGVQTLDDAVQKKTKRGHGLKETIDATKNVKDAFLKVGYHVMPGLYSTPGKDALMAKKLFSNPNLRPDMLKIYPALVIAGTALFDEWRLG
ncbi:radical SAM protein [Candidatus Micrarchaeota archaeon]|nr:radical SAM protein [Candidatus Micrarchaeota archaeon]